MRYLIGSIADWGALFKEAFRCCKPGGFVESVEVNPIFLSDDDTIASDSPINTWNKVCEEGGKAFGRSLCDVPDDVQLLRAAGFVDIQVTDFKVTCLQTRIHSLLTGHRFLLGDGRRTPSYDALGSFYAQLSRTTLKVRYPTFAISSGVINPMTRCSYLQATL